MTTWLVIPIKSLRDGKTRLAPSLDLAQRHTLMDRLLVHTLVQAAKFPGLDRTLIVSACDETRQRAAALGAQVLTESGSELNAAVQQGRTRIRELGATRMLVIPCDLPLLCADDLRSLSLLPESNGVVIAPDRNLHGTNGLCLDATSKSEFEFEFEFGPHSFARHKNEADRLKRVYTILQRPGLAFDVDTPEDLAEFCESKDYSSLKEDVSAH